MKKLASKPVLSAVIKHVMISDITQDIKVANVRLTYLGLIRIRFSTGSSFIRRGSGPGQRQGDERQVAAGLSQCHNAEETPTRFAHPAGDHRERVANNGHPTDRNRACRERWCRNEKR